VTNSNELEDREYMFVCKRCADDIITGETSREPNYNWRGVFRLEYDESGGRLMDRDLGWKSIPMMLPKTKGTILSIREELFGRRFGSVADQKRRIIVQLPELQQFKLYRLIQPFLLIRALQRPRKKEVQKKRTRRR